MSLVFHCNLKIEFLFSYFYNKIKNEQSHNLSTANKYWI
jgi:hypothetical protein